MGIEIILIVYCIPQTFILVWDATCPDTLAPSHIALASREPGLVTEQAEQQKKAKYADLLTMHTPLPLHWLGDHQGVWS